MFDVTWLPTACGSLAPALIPPAHIVILWYFWENYARYVDRHFCSCSCWDTVFKGPYESGVAAYKHMYFNATPNSFKMWILTVFAVIALYECIKRLIALILQQRVRYSMMMLFLLSIFSHYYAWWAYINYYNDDYYNQWNHQLFFTVSSSINHSVCACATAKCARTAAIHNLLAKFRSELRRCSKLAQYAPGQQVRVERNFLSFCGVCFTCTTSKLDLTQQERPQAFTPTTNCQANTLDILRISHARPSNARAC